MKHSTGSFASTGQRAQKGNYHVEAYILIVAGALVLGMGISTASFAEMPSLDSQSYTWPGSTINTSSDTDKIAPDPKTGKRPGILDWEGMGADVSRHPDKPGHDPRNCGICQ